MKKLFFVCFAFFAACAGASAQESPAPFPFFSDEGAPFAAAETAGPATTVALAADAERVPAGGSFSLLVRISMRPHWHVYWKNPGEAGMPLSVEWRDVPAGVEFGEWRWSAPKFYELMGIGSYVHEDAAYVEIPVKLAPDVPAGTALRLAGTASWLACDDNGCYPQDAEIAASVIVAPAGEAAVPANAGLFAEAEKTFPKRGEAHAEFRVGADGAPELVVAKKNGGTLDARARFFPENAKFSVAAAGVVPALEADGAVRFALPLNEGEAVADARELAGVLADGDGNAFEISPDEISATSGVPAAAPNASAEFFFGPAFLGALAAAFAGGLILNLMPCVFPVLGLKIMHFVGKAGAEKSKVARHGFVFGAGVLASFWALAGVLVALRGGGEQLGWGFQLQEPAFVYGMIVLLFVFGLSMSGVFEFGVGATSVGGRLQEKSGYAGSFFSGVLAVIVATPCAAPFLAPALGSALTLPAVPSFALFTAIALGLAAPYVLLSCAPSLLKFLPRPGAWMETFKQAMAFLLYAPALYFVWVLMGQIEDASAQCDLLISLAFVALACWIYGRWAVAWRPRATRVAGTLTALAVFAGTLIYAGTLLGAKKSEEWIPWTPEAQARALDEGRIVYVDFTARWCTTCQVNKRVYSDETLRAAFRDAGVVTMRADWTNRNPLIAAELRKYGRAAVPVNVFLKKGAEPVILGELFSGPGSVLDGLAETAGE
ncbi:MAG: protein-disulfide reductase DsbD family protein [Candidatus Spyradosoma sp.]